MATPKMVPIPIPSQESVECDWPGRPKQGKRASYDTTNRPKREGRREHRMKSEIAPFVAWDSEGYSDGDGYHHTMLWGNSLGETVRGESLTYKECFPLLLSPREPCIHVIFSGHYDVVQLTKMMPDKVLERLYSGKPVKYDGYRMLYRRGKWLDVKKLQSTERGVRLYDVFSFFQRSFVKACRDYLGNSPELEAMERMKNLRSSFTYGQDTVEPYWASENQYLVRLMEELRRLMAEVGIHPRYWHGPGAIASAIMTREKMRRYYETPMPEELIDIGERAYYGGRFEQFKVGRMEHVYEYDIRSAYPFAITRLRDFGKATWRHTIGKPRELSNYGLYRISWTIRNNRTPGPFPWRAKDGSIYYPSVGRNCWYWGVEVKAAIMRFMEQPTSFAIHEAWTPTFYESDRPFDFVHFMYENRALMKADGNPAERALKLGMNSLYGKLAQSKGARQNNKTKEWIKPSWHNVLWAGWITAHTRAQLSYAMRKHEDSIVAIETDALFSTKPLDHLTIGDGLGEWEETDMREILYISSGVYYGLRPNGVWLLKTRGVEADRSRSADEWLEIFAKLPFEKVEVTQKAVRYGSDLRQPETFGRWHEWTGVRKFPVYKAKRMHITPFCPQCHADPVPSYSDKMHTLVSPLPPREKEVGERVEELRMITGWDFDKEPSRPYHFPWRNDVEETDWDADAEAEMIIDQESIEWH